MIEHIGVGDETISLDAFNLNTKYSTSDHHTNLAILLQAKLAIIWHLIANHIVVLLNITNLFRDLILKRTAFEPCSLFLSVEDWEIVEGFWQYVDILIIK